MLTLYETWLNSWACATVNIVENISRRHSAAKSAACRSKQGTQMKNYKYLRSFEIKDLSIRSNTGIDVSEHSSCIICNFNYAGRRIISLAVRHWKFHLYRNTFHSHGRKRRAHIKVLFRPPTTCHATCILHTAAQLMRLLLIALCFLRAVHMHCVVLLVLDSVPFITFGRWRGHMLVFSSCVIFAAI